jgi:hypothetical protein
MVRKLECAVNSRGKGIKLGVYKTRVFTLLNPFSCLVAGEFLLSLANSELGRNSMVCDL